jgi:chromosome condensin MukBEF complex kleisin-like MukF subunit
MGSASRKALVQSMDLVERKENRQMVQDDIAGYLERDWT